MRRTRCHACRKALDPDKIVCPHCGTRQPSDPVREDNWLKARDPLHGNNEFPDPFRFLVIAVVAFVFVAILLTMCAALVVPSTPATS